jgi:hypothetical protein
MKRIALAAAAALVLAACSSPTPTGPSTPGTSLIPNGGANAGGGGGTAGGGTPTDSTGASGSAGSGTIVPVDSTRFTPADTTPAVATSGPATSLVFLTSGPALGGVGTCGHDGTWTAPDGTVSAPHSPKCLAYWSDGHVGNNGKGSCVASVPQGFPGVWINPGGHKSPPYHTQCLQTGATLPSLALTFSVQGTLYDATDGTGSRILNLGPVGGATTAQLVYHGTANDYTTGAGSLVATDNGVPAANWTVDFSQDALNWTTGLYNGDVIGSLASPGVPVVACNSAQGCVLVTLQITTH